MEAIKTSKPIQVLVEFPKTQEGIRELAQRVADIHAQHVLQVIRQLDCPLRQKQELLQAVIDASKEPGALGTGPETSQQ